eukprot:TRINITY_DN17463_c0_g2_i1.p1 TRINITY_DN17463_c0_g2~~TRINITY_DN17463_c0_g2_i1.p1  ORF type:complete len:429 (-),score=25.16 TRINITY_DN17463_c0_g2_i1:236-1522(-)
MQNQGACHYNKANIPRLHSVSISEFGAVGDGVTLNTHAFENAVFYVRSLAGKGGAQLFVPSGRWLTGSFNLTSHLTLNLDKDAVILGAPDPLLWPVIEPLPSYGRGRELPGGRHSALINGFGVKDVIITGDNGTIDGQGAVWWNSFRNKTLDYTRPHLIEFRDSSDIIISNLTLLNSPFWNIHPVYSSNVHIHDVTIVSPANSPNTDGIDPDSCSDVCIEDCYIRTGDDLISIKSGWDEYGISYGRPSSNITIRRITGETLTSAGLALGSEMSGGIETVRVENFHISNSKYGIRLKTGPGRGGFVKDVEVCNVTMNSAEIAFAFTGSYGDHPDKNYDPGALPEIKDMTFRDIIGNDIKVAGIIEGIPNDPFTGLAFSNIFLNMSSDSAWNCSNASGYSENVIPLPCIQLLNPVPKVLLSSPETLDDYL